MKIFKSRIIASVLTVAMVFSVLAVPVAAAETTATATTQPATTTEAASFLQEKGLLQGDNGNLMLDQELTREQMVVILSRLMGSEEEAISYPTDNMPFTDVPVEDAYAPYIAWAYDYMITQGMDETTFGFGGKLTAEQTKLFFVRALGYTDLTDEEQLAKADEVGVTAGSTAAEKAPITRANMALLMSNTVFAKTAAGTVLGADLGIVTPAEEPVVTPTTSEMTVAAASVKTITATFSAAVDTTKATFAVTKDSVKVNVSSVAFNDAKTVATLTMASNLTEGTYTVAVSGIDVKEATKTVTVKDEETGKIEFTTDKAILTNVDDVYTFIKVTNQYGQDITEDATLSFTASNSGVPSAQDKNGKVVIAGAYEKDDKITVTAIDSTSGAFASAVLTVVDAAAADAVTVAKVYCSDDKAVLRAESTDAFYVLFTAKDQYGNAMPVDTLADAQAIADSLLITSSNTSRVALSGLSHYNVSKLTVDNVDYVAVPLTVGSQAGSVSVRIISKTTGKSTVYDINVLEKAQVDTVSLAAPAIAVVGEDIEFVATVADKEGTAVTSVADMADTDVTLSGISGLGTAQATWKKDGTKLVLNIDANVLAAINDVNKDASKKNEYKDMILTVVTPTNKVIQKTVRVYEKAVPTTVGSLVNASTGVLKGYTTTIEATDDEDDNNVVVYDQYDRVYDYTDNSFFASYKLVFSVEDDTNVAFTGATAISTTQAAITADGDVATLTGVEKGSETVKVALYTTGSAIVTNSELEFTSNVAALADVKSYEVKDLSTVLAASYGALTGAGLTAADYAEEVEVVGILSNGSKLDIDPSLYSVVAMLPNTQAGEGLTVVNNTIKADTDLKTVPFETNKDITIGSVVVTIGGAEGPVTIQKPITVSKAAMVAETIALNDENAASGVTLDGSNVTIDKDLVTNASAIRSVVEVKDQYGVVNSTILPSSTIFSNINDENEATVLGLNNSTGAITSAADGDTFTVTYIYANGKSVTVNVNVID